MKRRTYLDSSVLIALASPPGPFQQRARAIYDDPRRLFLSSVYAELEVYPSAVRNKRPEEIAFYDRYFKSVRSPRGYRKVIDRAMRIISRHPVSPMDALHLAAALELRADELVTLEKPHKGICKTGVIPVLSLYPG